MDDVRGFHDLGPEFEDVVLSTIVNDEDFTLKFMPILDPELFQLETNGFILRTIKEFFEKYDKTPEPTTLVELIKRSRYANKGEAIAKLETLEPSTDIQYVTDRLVCWAKWRAIDGVNGLIYEDPVEYATNIMKASETGDELLGKSVSLMDDDDESGSGDDFIPTPWPSINTSLEGGLLYQDFGVILTIPNGGKTTILVNIAKKALEEGKVVVYLTFEDGERKVHRRFMQCITGMSRTEMTMDVAKARRVRDRFMVRYGGHCEIKDMRTRVDSVASAMSFIKSVEKRIGRKVDMVVTDYAERFKPTQRYSEPRHAIREIFEDCKFLARHLNVVHWTAKQGNKTSMAQDYIGMDNSGESFGAMESPDVVLGFSQNKEQALLEEMVMYTAKMRDGESKQSKMVNVDFEIQRIWERGND